MRPIVRAILTSLVKDLLDSRKLQVIIVAVSLLGIIGLIRWNHRPGSTGKRAVSLGELPILTRTDSAGDVWTLEPRAGQSPYLIAKTGRQRGEPLLVKADVLPTRAQGEFSIGLDISGQAAELYSAAVKKNRLVLQAPQYRVTSRAGRVLAQGVFAYG